MGATRGQLNGTEPIRDSAHSDQAWRTGWIILAFSCGLLALILIAGLTAGCSPGQTQPPAGHAARPAAPVSSPTPPHPVSGPARATASSRPNAHPAGTGRTKPARVKIPDRGPRSYRPATTSAGPVGKRGALITYNVRIQKGLPYDPEYTARFIHRVLNDRRSWGRSGQWRIKLVGPRTKADVGVYLVTPRTTDALCKPLRTSGKVSCFNHGRVVLNARRWAYGAASYGHDLLDYRRNVVNHEFGHALGFGHLGCPRKGRLAPIMMQQTKGLHGCRANPWPFPKA